MDNSQPRSWRSVEELVEIGFQRSRVVMMNEAHAGDLRCVRTRVIGRRILPAAHKMGARYLAMEALWPEIVGEANRTHQLGEAPVESYLAQPEMRSFIQTALDLGWTLVPYEADFSLEPPGLPRWSQINWREEMQARNLIAFLHSMPGNTKMLVWCGNSHHAKMIIPKQADDPQDGEWVSMGYQFKALSGIDPFVIDQIRTVHFPALTGRRMEEWLNEVAPQLTSFGRTAGFLAEEAPACFHVSSAEDAYVVSLDNEME
ncbi:MAG: hypothetical protein ACRDIV_07945 [Ktedonobacteraceae bacterium]